MNPDKKKAAARSLYSVDPDKKKAASRALYSVNPDKKKAAARSLYSVDPDKKKAASRALYSVNPDKKKAAARARYRVDPDKKKAAARARYRVYPDKKKAASCIYYANNHSARLRSFRKYHCCHQKDIRLFKKARYILAQPKPTVKEMYLKDIQLNLAGNFEAMSQLRGSFKELHPGIAKQMPRVLGRTVCRLAARRLLNKALQLRKIHAGCLLKDIRSIKSTKITNRDDFGEGCHSASTEPYFYDSSYQYVRRFSPIPINEAGECVVAKEIESDTGCSKKAGSGKESLESTQKKKWECSSECKPVSDAEVDAILELKAAFEMSLQDVRHALDSCDWGCPNGHYTRLIGSNPIDLKGHPLVCSNDGGCQSKLRVLRAASTHFPVLRKLLRGVHSAITNHKCVFEIDKALCTGN